MICTICGVWDIQAGDYYCGCCRRKLVRFTVRVSPDRFSRDEVPPPARLTLANGTGSPALEIHAVEATAGWLCVLCDGVEFPFTLEPGESRALSVEVDPLAAEPDEAEAAIVVRTSAGAECELHLNGGGLARLPLRVELLEGSLVVAEAAAEPGEWARIEPPETAWPATLEACSTAALPLVLEVDTSRLLALLPELPATAEGTFHLRGPEFDHEERLAIRCWLAPQLSLAEESGPRLRLWRERNGVLELLLRNQTPGDRAGGRANAPVEIRGVRVAAPSGEPVPWIGVQERFPFVLNGGETRRILLRTGGGEEPPAGDHQLRLEFETNLEPALRELDLEIEVVSPPLFDGVLALDFGTSNTCCAALGDGEEELRVLPIDSPEQNEDPSTAPTVIQYCRLPAEDRPEVEIGALADARAGDPRVGASVVRSLKRRLGAAGGDLEVRFFQERQLTRRYPARRMVADYLAGVRRAAEREARARFSRLIVTHPARFRVNQVRELQSAVRQAFGEACEITLLEEPVAAAIEFVTGEEALARDAYSLGIFDFGGGTTDLSLLSVENRREQGLCEVRARLLASTGRWFGGEDITRFVRDAGLRRSRESLDRLGAHARVLLEGDAPEDSWHARLNQGRLLRWAEATKLLLVEHGDSHADYLPPLPDLFPSLRLSVANGSGPAEQAFPHATLAPAAADLRAYLEPFLESLAGDLGGMAGRAGIGCMDYLLLSGKSSAIPLVGEVLGRCFPGARLVAAREPKQCVVRGAATWEKFQRAAGIALNLDSLGSTPARFGFQDVGPGGALLFREWIAAGVPVPAEGIAARRPFFLNRRTRVVLLENSGARDELRQDGRENPDIAMLGAWEPEAGADLPGARSRVELELRVSPGCEFEIRAVLENGVAVRFLRREIQGKDTTT